MINLYFQTNQASESHMTNETNHYIDGSWQTGQGASFSSISPVNGDVVWTGTSANTKEVKEAVEAAHKAFGAWATLDMSERMTYLKAFAQQIDHHSDALAELISKETGKPLWESKTEAKSVVGKIQISIDAYHERTGAKTTEAPDSTGHLRFKPHGVVAVLGPFNFPAHLSNGHIVPALLAGNTVVLKPSELTPGVAEFIIQCWDKSNLPNGVINCIQGDVQTAKDLINEDIQGVFFTGSFAAGLAINKQLSDRPEVILALEMGGNNPLIVDDVRDQTLRDPHEFIHIYVSPAELLSPLRPAC
jgi:succinylglutamic semialdehyde dehydrogenase